MREGLFADVHLLMRVLVTGANGFIGVRVASALWGRGDEVVEGTRAAGLDLREIGGICGVLERFGKLDVVIHAAAMRDPAACERNREEAVVVNFSATREIAKWCAGNGVKLIFLSSDQVFDGAKGSYVESDARQPVNHYGVTKALAEDVVFEVGGTVARVALTMGVSREGNRAPNEFVVNALREGKAVALFENEFRSPILVEDLARALVGLIGTKERCVHVGGPGRVSRVEMGLALAEAFQLPRELCAATRHDPMATGVYRPLDCSMSTQLLSQVLNMQSIAPPMGLKEAAKALAHASGG